MNDFGAENLTKLQQKQKKVEECVLQISVHHFLGWNICQNSTRPFFFFHCVVKRKIYLENLGAIYVRDKDEISI